MNGILPTPINENRIKKTLALILTLGCLLPVIINITCLTPLLFILENDTLYQGGAVSLTVKYISDLLTVLSFISVYAIIIFFKTLSKRKIVVTVSVLYFVLLALKIPASLLMVIPVYGEIILADVLMLSFYFLLDSLQFVLILIFVTVTVNSYLRSVEVISKSNKKAPSTGLILPIGKYFDWYNPLLRASFYSAITVAGFRIFSRLISSIGISAPESFKEAMVMIVDYFSDLVYGVAAYIIAIFVFNLLYDMLTKQGKNDKNNNSSQNKNKADEDDSSALFED